jgi:hypothetical protein
MSGPIATAGCPYCDATFPVSHGRLGSIVRCVNCTRSVVAHVPTGGSVPVTGYGLDYRDFRQLLQDGEGREPVQKLIARWFDYRLQGDGSEVLVLNREGEAIDPLWLHLRIQDDAEKQGELYRTAMTLWR